jgi:hypothetical protein
MHWLLLIVRFLTRALSGNEGNSVALAARIDGRIEQQRSNLGDESDWSLFAFWRRSDRAERRKGVRRDRPRAEGRRSSAGGSPPPRD